MTFKALIGAVVVASILALAPPVQGGLPEGWIMAGSKPSAYEGGVEPHGGQQRGPAGYLKSREADVAGFGTMMQSFQAADYLGKRVRLSATVRTENVREWAGLWMRVDAPDRGGIAFDNMQERAIKGTTGWTRYEVVLDVANDASLIAFGILISGTGAAWLDGVKVEVVPSTVATTATKVTAPQKRAPQNLDFSAQFVTR